MVQASALTDTSQGNNSYYGNAAKTDAAAKTQDMFVTLLLAQVKNQDPMKPMDNMEFTNQLATFNQLNEMQKVNTNLEKQNEFNTTMSQTSYLNLLDKKVTALGSEVVVSNAGANQNLEFQLNGESSRTNMTFVDDRGMVRATLDIGQKGAGDNSYNWDGKDENGRALPAGNYSILLSGMSKGGDEVSGSLYATGVVSTVTSLNGETVLKFNNGQSITTKDIIKVETKPTTAI